jgi:hypothetical protein
MLCLSHWESRDFMGAEEPVGYSLITSLLGHISMSKFLTSVDVKPFFPSLSYTCEHQPILLRNSGLEVKVICRRHVELRATPPAVSVAFRARLVQYQTHRKLSLRPS